MEKNINEISNQLMEIEIMTKRAYVLSEDLREGYFSEMIESQSSTWRAMPPYCDQALTKIEIVSDLIFDITKSISYLQSALNANSTSIDENYKLSEIMDRYDCNMEVARLILQGKK